VVRHSGFADLQPGEAVALRIVDGQRGRMAVQIISWESGQKK
jgi:CspA family cold shock protein